MFLTAIAEERKKIKIFSSRRRETCRLTPLCVIFMKVLLLSLFVFSWQKSNNLFKFQVRS